MAVKTAVRSDMMRRRMRGAFGVILLCYGGLVGRLVYLQGMEGPRLQDEALHNRLREIRLTAHRGTITDRNGSPMAVSSYVGIVGFDPSVLVAESKNPKKAKTLEDRLTKGIHTIATLTGRAENEIVSLVQQARADYPAKSKSRFIVVQKDISLQTAQTLRDMNPMPIGFGVQDDSRRIYTSKQYAAQVVGMTDPDGKGLAGMERSCGKWLNGTPGKVIAEVDRNQREIPDTEIKRANARDGSAVQTTLDTTIQHIATEEAQKIVEKYHPKGVSVVIVEPETGDILALVSLPNYDPNPEGRKRITVDALTDRCAALSYEPGSTMKTLTVAAALNDGTITAQRGFQCSGTLRVDKSGKLIHCDSHGGSNVHGWVTPADILRESCNVGAAQIGLLMGPHKLYEAEAAFGLFEPLGIELPGTTRGRLSFDKREKIYTAAKAARVSFGHSITTTPLHVAMAYAAIANGGNLMQPRLVTQLKDSNGNVTQKFAPKVRRQVVKPEVAAEVTGMLEKVISDGTGKIVATPGYFIAGKTGTAHKYKAGKYIGSFAGFLPAGGKAKPRAVILVAVDEPQNGHYGAEVAAPAFQKIASRVMAYLHVPEDDPDATQYKMAQENLHPGSHARKIVTH